MNILTSSIIRFVNYKKLPNFIASLIFLSGDSATPEEKEQFGEDDDDDDDIDFDDSAGSDESADKDADSADKNKEEL